MREEDKAFESFSMHRKIDFLDGRVKKLEKQVERLSKLYDPRYQYGYEGTGSTGDEES
jgi:hypothetical protein